MEQSMSKYGYGAIDTVVNLFTPDAFERNEIPGDPDFLAKVQLSTGSRRGVPLDEYLRKMDRAGIERSFLIAKRCGDMRIKGSVETRYEVIHKVCQQYPDRFSGLAGIDPFRGMEGLRELEKAVKEYGFVGAHLYPHWFSLPPNDAKFYPYYAKCCELDISIMMQVGNCLVYQKDRRLPSVGRPITLDQIAIDFPELTLIGIHIGWPWHDEMIAMAWKHPNVYIGVDAYAPKHWPASFVHFANTFGQDKVIFGSDWPVIDPERAMNELEIHNFKPDSLRKILRDNTVRIFKLDERLKKKV